MDGYGFNFVHAIKVITLALCWINYGLSLYKSKWDFGSLTNVGWLMAVLGWTSVVING